MPYPKEPAIDINPVLTAKYTPKKMVEDAESFFVGLGFDNLPNTFWERSVFTKPTDGRKVVCHASAWDVNYDNDLRLKACLQTTQQDYVTVHHELGHLYYYHSYYKMNILFQAGANDGFHEAIGDTITLSLTPEYLKSKGLLTASSTTDEAVINDQLFRALSKVAFLPFGYLIDKWRWDVFEGRVSERQWNQHYWKLRQEYQGIASPVKRMSNDLDALSKYHVAANVPYMRYFLAAILQFQFHEALCRKANFTGPLHMCSIAGSKEAGAALKGMLSMGASRPWQEALKNLTGSSKMDTKPIMTYFSPLKQWLEAQNAKESCGFPRDAAVQPLDEKSHLGLMLGLAALAAAVIFMGAGVFNHFQKKSMDYQRSSQAGSGATKDYAGL